MTEISVDIGQRIQKARKNAKLNQSQLAKALGKTLRTVQNYESGDVEPSISVLMQIAGILYVHPSELVGPWATQVQLNNMGDFVEMLYALTSRAEIDVDLEIHNSEENKNPGCSIYFPESEDAAQNHRICLVLQEFENKKALYEAGKLSRPEYVSWLRVMKDILSGISLTDKYSRDITPHSEG